MARFFSTLLSFLVFIQFVVGNAAAQNLDAVKGTYFCVKNDHFNPGNADLSSGLFRFEVSNDFLLLSSPTNDQSFNYEISHVHKNLIFAGETDLVNVNETTAIVIHKSLSFEPNNMKMTLRFRPIHIPLGQEKSFEAYATSTAYFSCTASS